MFKLEELKYKSKCVYLVRIHVNMGHHKLQAGCLFRPIRHHGRGYVNFEIYNKDLLLLFYSVNK